MRRIPAGQQRVEIAAEDIRGFGHRKVDIGIVPLLIGVGDQHERLRLGARRFLRADHAVFDHQIQNDAAPSDGRLGPQMRRIGRRGLQNACEQSALGKRQLGGVHAEIALRRGFDAVIPAAEVDAVQIAGQNLVLAEKLLKPVGEDRFVDLAVERLFGGQVRQLDELLRDGARALHVRARLKVVQRRARDADEVKAWMRIEPRVLRGKKGVAHVRRKRFGIDGHAVFVQVEPGDDRAVFVRDQKRFLGRIDLLKVQQTPRVLRKDPDRAGKQRGEDHNCQYAKKTPTAASATETFIGSDGLLLAHTDSMRKTAVSMRAEAGSA